MASRREDGRKVGPSPSISTHGSKSTPRVSAPTAVLPISLSSALDDDQASPERMSTSTSELRRPYEAQTPTKYRKPLDTSTPSTAKKAPTPRRVNGSSASVSSVARGTDSTRPSSSVSNKARPGVPPPLAQKQAPSNTVNQPCTNQQDQQQQQYTRAMSNASPTNTVTSLDQLQQRDFQYPSDIPSVRVRYVNVAQRSVFGVPSLPSLSEWERILNATATTNGTDANANMSAANMTTATHHRKRKMSPSHRHLALMHRLQNCHVIRQVQFSPSTGLDADYFYSYESQMAAALESDQSPPAAAAAAAVEGLDGQHRRPNLKSGLDIRDGRYRTIDPLTSSLAALSPNNTVPPPQLSHQKHRLPNRADVGFPNPSAEDVACKQGEIRNETAWEESSPRLAQLVTSDDLGIVVEDEATSPSSGNYPYGCKDMPFAGRNLAMAKALNARHFGRSKGIRLDGRQEPLLLPNPYSMLAPPLESTYSPSQGWRPRQFHDRPVGMHYCLAWPLAVTMPECYNKDKLLYSLALYTLPPCYKDTSHMVTAAAAAAYHCKKQGRTSPPAFGKMSEECWFPIGDWSDSRDHRQDETRMKAELLQSWMQNQHKAIFSYDPLSLAMERTKHNVDGSLRLPGSLYIAVQVFRTVSVSPDGGESSSASLLHPIAFGVTKFFPSSTEKPMYWPNGQTKELQLHAYPDSPGSQASFVELLWNVLYRTSTAATAFDDSSSSTIADDLSILSLENTNGDNSMLGKKKSITTRLFRTPKRSQTPPPRLGEHRRSVSANVVASNARQQSVANKIGIGRARLFLSSLHSDFLQAMLTSPTDIELIQRNTATRVPKILVDASGDFAVLLEGAHSEPRSSVTESMDFTINKRSNLVRLPFPVESAGYCASGEFREVLCLPARPEKHYDVDCHFSPSRAFLNLLYLYPRLLRVSPKMSSNRTLSRFTVRVRILRSELGDNGPPNANSVRCFHNPSPWTENGLLDSSYTKIVGDLEHGLLGDIEVGLPLNDEMKIRLPDILDGTYRFEFTLYSVETSGDSGVSLAHIAEASVPLTSSASSRDASTGIRVATIIPNGKHRLELGDYQLHLETRLVSSIHTGDPTVAAALSDRTSETEHVEISIGRSSSGISLPDNGTMSFSSWASSSESTLTAFFHMLICVHLSYFIESADESPSESALNPHLYSLIEILSKVKTKLVSLSVLPTTEVDFRFRMFMKNFIDSFDEASLTDYPSIPSKAESEEDVIEFPVSSKLEHSKLVGDTVSEGDHSNQQEVKTEVTSSARKRVKKRKSMKERPGAPFSRVAFGATKTDRMRAEAELRDGSRHWAPFFDDDETIATAPSIYSGSQKTDTHLAVSIETSLQRSTPRSPLIAGLQDDNSIVRSSSSTSFPTDEKRSLGENEFVQRVRTAASVILAPCVAPSLTNMLKTAATSPRDGVKKSKGSYFIPDGEAEPSIFAGPAGICLCSPGSDAEDDNKDDEAARLANNSTARKVPEQLIVLSLSSGTKNTGSSTRKGQPFLYEVIMALYVKNFRELADCNRNSSSQNVERTEPSALCASYDFVLPLCLKSIVLRFATEKETLPTSTKALVDDGHLTLLESFVETLVHGLMQEACDESSSALEQDTALRKADKSAGTVLDFLVGLLSVVHTRHVRGLLETFFKAIRDAESRALERIYHVDPHLSHRMLHRAKCYRQLRLCALETLASLPAFIALNSPMKFAARLWSQRPMQTTWLHQFRDSPSEGEEIGTSNVSGWLVRIVLGEALSICAVCSHAVLEEAISTIELSLVDALPSALKKRHGLGLDRSDLLALQSMAIHAINVVYELAIRRHVLDRRFQSETSRTRVAGLVALPILDHSIASTRWLSKMEATHKVRSIWLLCFAYVLQEAPEAQIYDFVRSCYNNSDLGIHRFIRLLRLSCASFQSFLDLQRYGSAPSEYELLLSPWLLQESFNTICATCIVVVDVCIGQLQDNPDEKRAVMQGVLDLLLLVLTTPQSSVTHLRAAGGAMQILEYDADLFFEAVGSGMQHWARIILSLMNSVSLSVRSIAVDFVLSLFASVFRAHGSIDALALVFATVLPEVVAREIALYSVGGHISCFGDVARTLWPLRRGISDLGESDPSDDDRLDLQLAPVLSAFCRACQAVIDGVLVELRLQEDLSIVGSSVKRETEAETVFDADQESLYEASSFFNSESAPIQKVRWLLALKSLHVSKSRWVEAGECLHLCGRAVCDALSHLKVVWRPSRFALWSDHNRSIWLDTVGQEMGHPDRGNAEVISFAEQFLEPPAILGSSPSTPTGKLQTLTMSAMCELLVRVAGESVDLFAKDPSTGDLAWLRLESMLRDLMVVADEHSRRRGYATSSRSSSFLSSMKGVDEEAALRRAIGSIGGLMNGLLQGQLPQAQTSPRQYFVLIQLSGAKPLRFEESTAIPPFFEWGKPCVCRVPNDIVDTMGQGEVTATVCLEFARQMAFSLRDECVEESVVVRTEPRAAVESQEKVTYLDVFPLTVLESHAATYGNVGAKHFFHRKGAALVETTVARGFPGVLSRQSALLTADIMTTKTN